MQQPRVTLRISAELYRELVAIAEARDCTLQQALDFYLERVRQQAMEEARQMQLKGMPKAKTKPKPKPKANPKPEPKMEMELGPVHVEAHVRHEARFRCKVCDQEFEDFSVARDHLKKAHPGQRAGLDRIKKS